MWLVLAFILQAVAFDIPFRKVSYMKHYGKIVGGDEAYPGEFPYQISIKDTSNRIPYHFCGGSIISPDWVITAAHCMAGESSFNPSGIVAVAGEHRLSDETGDEQIRKISRIFMHKKFNKKVRYSNDIALIRMESPFNFTDYVAPAVLQDTPFNLTQDCTVTGWGTLSSGGCRPDTLQKVDVPLISIKECKEAYSKKKISESMFCAGNTVHGGVDSCQGDSGGPLYCDGYLTGIVSWGYSCATPEYPGVYTNISYFTNWIDDQKQQYEEENLRNAKPNFSIP